MSRRRQKANKFKHPAGDDPTGFANQSGNALEASEGTGSFRSYGKPWDAPKQASRKAQQLCQQVRDALTGALAACGDPAVQAGVVIAVGPAPHTGRLRVLVGAPTDVGREAVQAAVDRAAGHLRSEVATAISRRHAPELVFEVIPM